MSSRCLNKVILIGNLTRDPELRYTPNGVPVCSFGLATNRSWTTQDGQRKDEAQFHKIVAWNQLAEVCAKVLTKGRRIYVEGRIQYREWTGNDNLKRLVAEIIIEDMILLDSRREGSEAEEEVMSSQKDEEIPADIPVDNNLSSETKKEDNFDNELGEEKTEGEEGNEEGKEEESNDIPF